MAKLIDGKAIAAQIRDEVAQETQALKSCGVTPGLAVVLVGEDPASCTYVRNKQKACADAGIYAEQITLPATTTQEELLRVVQELNARAEAIYGRA